MLRQEMRDRLESIPGMDLDYATIVDSETLQETTSDQASLVALVAASIGNIRLIDNLPLESNTNGQTQTQTAH